MTPSQETMRKLYSYFSKRVLQDSNIRHYLPSIIYSPEDQTTSGFLINLSAEAIKVAWAQELTCGKSDLEDSQFLNIFPGEHYRLLSAFVQIMQANTIVEVGTYTGMGCLALCSGLRGDGKVYTYDVIEWDKLGVPSHLTDADFKDGRIEQVIGDLSIDEVFEHNVDVLNKADLIFMDAPKDGVFEYKMLDKLSALEKKFHKLLILDDIRFINMIDFWRNITSPKLDISGFGHWSGTGLVDISDGLTYLRK
jgi:hypothetical protein